MTRRRHELSSMGIRVTGETLHRQLELTGQLDFLKLPYHQAVVDDRIPLSIGGGIGQSRTTMLLLKKAHLGEVSVTVWPRILAEAAERGPRGRRSPGRSGARTSASGSGARSARTTARTATPGTTSRTTSPAPGPTGGARTASAGSPTTSSVCASPSRSGTSGTRSSRSALFGLTNSEGNHGEDVKEYYFYLDSTPTHSYMKYLYKYPQREFPYRDLVETNRRRTREELEYELLDTGIFDDDRYFDVFVEYAKAGPDDILIRVSVHNRGTEAARLHLLPTLWFRNTWSWGDEGEKPVLREKGGAIVASHPELGDYTLSCDGAPELLFTENESERPEALGPAEPDAVREGRVPPLRDRRRAGRGESRRRPGRRPRRATSSRCRRAAARSSSSA